MMVRMRQRPPSPYRRAEAFNSIERGLATRRDDALEGHRRLASRLPIVAVRLFPKFAFRLKSVVDLNGNNIRFGTLL